MKSVICHSNKEILEWRQRDIKNDDKGVAECWAKKKNWNRKQKAEDYLESTK